MRNNLPHSVEFLAVRQYLAYQDTNRRMHHSHSKTAAADVRSHNCHRRNGKTIWKWQSTKTNIFNRFEREKKIWKGNWTLKICPSVFDLNMSINWQKLKGKNRVSVPLERNVGMKRMQTTSGHETISFQSMVLIFIFFLNFGIWANNHVLWLQCEDCVYDTVPVPPQPCLFEETSKFVSWATWTWFLFKHFILFLSKAFFIDRETSVQKKYEPAQN